MSRPSFRYDSTGSALLLVAGFLVVATPMLAVILGLRVYFEEEAFTQHRLDEAAIFGARLLPYQLHAREAIAAELSKAPDLSVSTVVRIENDVVEVVSTRRVPFLFSNVLPELTLTVRASAQRQPIDAHIVLDASDYLAPDLFSGVPWGDASHWPSAPQAWNQTQRSEDGDAVPVDPYLATQQCFNPVFSELKRTALEMYDFFRGFNQNAVGFGVHPGPDAPGADTLSRPAFRGGDPIAGVEPRFDVLGYQPYRDGATRDALCYAIARESGVPSFSVPVEPRDMISIPAHCEPESADAGYPPFEFDRDDPPPMRARDLLWSLPVRRNLVSDCGALFSSAALEVLNTSASARYTFPSAREGSCESLILPHSRGIFENRARKIGVLLLGALPSIRPAFSSPRRVFSGNELLDSGAPFSTDGETTPSGSIHHAIQQVIVPALRARSIGTGVADDEFGTVRRFVPSLELFVVIICSTDISGPQLSCASRDLRAFQTFLQYEEAEARIALSDGGNLVVAPELKLTLLSGPEGVVLKSISAAVMLAGSAPVLRR